jgi:hypothetical protein
MKHLSMLNLFAKEKWVLVKHSKKLLFWSVLLLSLFTGKEVFAQFPHPSPQTLPYVENFNTSLATATTTTYPSGWRAYKLASAAPSSGGRTANPTADIAALTASGTAGSSGSGAYNFTGKLGWLSTASFDAGMVLSLTTTGSSGVKLNFDLMTIRNPYDGSTNTYLEAVVLMYRTDTTAAFTTISYSPAEYQQNTTTQTSTTTTGQQIVNCSVTLPSACDNKSVVEVRWVARALSGTGGSRPSFAIDNVSAGVVPSLSTPTVASITDVSALLGANITSSGSGSLSARGTAYKTTSSVVATDNALADGSTSTGVFTQSRTGLSPQTRYYFAGYATNNIGTSLSSESNFYTLSSPPTSAASSFSGTAVSSVQIDLSWVAATFPSSGATVNKYLLLRAISPNTPTLSSQNGNSPSAGSNTTIVTADIASNSTSYSATGLSSNTTYNFVIIPYTFDGTNSATYNYYTSSAPTASATTPNGITQPSNLQFSNITCSQMTAKWNRASGSPDGYLVLRTTGATAPNTNPVDGVTYSAGNTLGNATVLYVGNDSSITSTGLSDSTTYRYKIFSYSGSTFLTAGPLEGNQVTANPAAPVATAATSIGTSSFTANWNTANCASSYVIDVSKSDSFKLVSTIAQWSFPVSGTIVYSDTLFSNSNNTGKQISLSSGTITDVSSTTTRAASATTWTSTGKYWQVEVNTTGFTNLTLSSAQ